MQGKIQNISPIKQRILQFVEYLNVTKREFYAKCGISRGTLENNTGITEESLAKLFATYKQVNPLWVVTGEGEMLRDEKNVAKKVDAKCIGSIPLIPLNAFAGAVKGEMQVLEYECDHYVVPIFKEADFLIPVKGSSMIPKYSSGDIVACKRIPSDTFFQWNKVYVLDTEQGALIKRIKKAESPDHILLVSENDKYEPFELPINKINALAIVVGVIRLE